jgi:hypothetical protein
MLYRNVDSGPRPCFMAPSPSRGQTVNGVGSQAPTQLQSSRSESSRRRRRMRRRTMWNQQPLTVTSQQAYHRHAKEGETMRRKAAQPIIWPIEIRLLFSLLKRGFSAVCARNFSSLAKVRLRPANMPSTTRRSPISSAPPCPPPLFVILPSTRPTAIYLSALSYQRIR